MCPGVPHVAYWTVEEISTRLDISVDNLNQLLKLGILRSARLDHPSGRAYWLGSDLASVRTLK